MADYLFVFRGGDAASAGMSPESMQQHMQKWGAWMKQLSESGRFKSGEPLEARGKVVRGKRKQVTDGPFAEAKDLVGGYVLLTADSLDHAVELAQGCPIYETDGSVEVRPVQIMNMG